MAPILILFSVFTMAYQVNKPCDDKCFARKLNQNSKNTKNKRIKDDNSWRYRNNRGDILGGYVE